MSSDSFVNTFLTAEEFKDIQHVEYKHINIENYSIGILGIPLMENGINWNVKPHNHSFFELHYVVIGNEYTTINKTEMKVNENEFYIMPPGTIHSHRQDIGTEHIGFAIRWEFTKYCSYNGILNSYNSTEIDKICSALLNIQSYSIKDNMEIYKQFVKLVQGSCRLTQFEIEIELFQIIIKFSKLYAESKSYKSNYHSEENKIVFSIMQFIEDNYSQEIDVNDISQYVYLSYSYISRLFKEYTGQTIVSYINDTRLKKAQYLLKCTTKSICDISSDVGFNNQNYFCNTFKKSFNKSPIDFRKTICELTE